MDQMLSKDGWPDDLAFIERRDVMDALAQLLGVSDFLWEDFLRMQHGNLFPILRDLRLLKNAKTKDEMRSELDKILSSCKAAARSASTDELMQLQREHVNSYKDREMFRIDMRHIMKMISVFGDFSDMGENYLTWGIAGAGSSVWGKSICSSISGVRWMFMAISFLFSCMGCSAPFMKPRHLFLAPSLPV